MSFRYTLIIGLLFIGGIHFSSYSQTTEEIWKDEQLYIRGIGAMIFSDSSIFSIAAGIRTMEKDLPNSLQPDLMKGWDLLIGYEKKLSKQWSLSGSGKLVATNSFDNYFYGKLKLTHYGKIASFLHFNKRLSFEALYESQQPNDLKWKGISGGWLMVGIPITTKNESIHFLPNVQFELMGFNFFDEQKQYETLFGRRIDRTRLTINLSSYLGDNFIITPFFKIDSKYTTPPLDFDFDKKDEHTPVYGLELVYLMKK